jgi:rhamnose transport system permease protein
VTSPAFRALRGVAFSGSHRREIAIALAIAALAVVLALTNPAYFSPSNLTDLLLANAAVLAVALGGTLVIIAGEIDISVGSIFAISSIVAGIAATSGWPLLLVALSACAIGAALGIVNGVLVAYVGIPSIVATLAAMIGLRDGLRWTTQGAWIENLPAGFQWFGLPASTFPVVVGALLAALVAMLAWAMRHAWIGRAIYATGSNPEAARLVGIDPALVKCGVFVASGLLTGFGALINAVRFNQIPSNGGLGLELKAIAAVVVGGAAVTGGRGTIAGTVLGVVLLGAIGPALTFMGVSAYWERAIHGAIILTAVSAEAVRLRRPKATATAVAVARG